MQKAKQAEEKRLLDLQNTKTFHRFLDLPREVRNKIYDYSLGKETILAVPIWTKPERKEATVEHVLELMRIMGPSDSEEDKLYKWSADRPEQASNKNRDCFDFPSILQANQQTRHEAQLIFFGTRTFTLTLEPFVTRGKFVCSMTFSADVLYSRHRGNDREEVGGVLLPLLAQRFFQTLTEEQFGLITKMTILGHGPPLEYSRRRKMFRIDMDLKKEVDDVCTINSQYPMDELLSLEIHLLIEEVACRGEPGEEGRFKKGDLNKLVGLLDWNEDTGVVFFERNLL